MALTPNQWQHVTTGTYEDVRDNFNDYEAVNAPRRWEFVFTGSTQQFTVPSGVTRIRVECIGGGSRSGATGTQAKSGGGGGSYAMSVFDVTPSQQYDVVVGRGATPSLSATHSTFDLGGSREVIGASGSGTSARPELCVGSQIFPGGDGGSRLSTTSAGGGGGGGAGPNGPGVNGDNGWSAGAGGKGGLGNNAASRRRGRGGNGGRRAVPEVAGQPGQGGQPGIPPQTVTRTYYATWSRSWYNYGVHHNSPALYQGNPLMDGVGPTYGKMGFNRTAIANDLENYSIDRVRLRLRLQHSWWFSGLNPGARIGIHNTGSNTSPPGGSSSTGGSWNQWTFFNGWQAGQTRFCTLPNHTANSLRNGNAQGFSTGRHNAGNRDDYGYFYGANSSNSWRPMLEIRFIIPGQDEIPGDPGSPAIGGHDGHPGDPGAFPGGGGGGAGWGDGQSLLSGNGAHGFVRITEVA